MCIQDKIEVPVDVQDENGFPVDIQASQGAVDVQDEDGFPVDIQASQGAVDVPVESKNRIDSIDIDIRDPSDPIVTIVHSNDENKSETPPTPERSKKRNREIFSDYMSPSTHSRIKPRSAFPKNVHEVVTPPKYIRPEGRRILSMSSIEYLLNIGSQHRGKCQADCLLQIVKETQTGLSCTLYAKCTKCFAELPIPTDRGYVTLKIKVAAVWATYAGATGYSSMNHIFMVMDIPFMSLPTFSKIEKGSFHKMTEDTQLAALKQNGEEEVELARALGQVETVHGKEYVCTEVYGDGQWAKRSYNNAGTSLSGSAVLIGKLSRKPLLVGVRNSFCFVCCISAKAASIQPHACFKNWDKGASAMEASIMLEGFQQSMDFHGLVSVTATLAPFLI
jgi:hypothetical protein